MNRDKLPEALPAPARHALEAAGYRNLEQLAGADERELKRLHGVGPKAIRIIRESLKERRGDN